MPRPKINASFADAYDQLSAIDDQLQELRDVASADMDTAYEDAYGQMPSWIADEGIDLDPDSMEREATLRGQQAAELSMMSGQLKTIQTAVNRAQEEEQRLAEAARRIMDENDISDNDIMGKGLEQLHWAVGMYA
jgi:hypothetical protein